MNSGVHRFAWFHLILVTGGLAWADEQPKVEKPKADESLQQLLKRFPEADANKDGVLTRDEAREYRQQALAETKQKAGEAIKPTEADVKYGPAQRNYSIFIRPNRGSRRHW